MIFILGRSVVVRHHCAHLKERETEAHRQEATWLPPPPNKGAAGSGEEPLPPISGAHALSISLIKTIDLFILSGGEGGKKPNMPFV